MSSLPSSENKKDRKPEKDEKEEELKEPNDNDAVKYGMMKEWFQSMGEEVAEVERRTQSFRIALMGVVLLCFVLASVSIAFSTSASAQVGNVRDVLTQQGQRYVELGTPKKKGGCVPILSCNTRKVHPEQTKEFDNLEGQKGEL